MTGPSTPRSHGGTHLPTCRRHRRRRSASKNSFWQHLVDRIRGGETHPQNSNQGRDKQSLKSNQGRGMHSLKSRQGRDKHPPKSSWLRFLLARKRVPPAVSTACADETIAVKNISQKAPTAISSGRMPPGRKKNSDREGGVEGGMRLSLIHI